MKKPYEIRFKLQTFTVHDSATPEGKSYRDGVPLRDAQAVATYARAIYQGLDADKEHFTLFTLNNKNRVTGFKVISTGSLTASIVHPREVFSAALEMRAAAIVLVHNHPSGDPAPSAEDIDITRRLKECADLLGIRCLDHVVLGDRSHFSFSEKGML